MNDDRRSNPTPGLLGLSLAAAAVFAVELSELGLRPAGWAFVWTVVYVAAAWAVGTGLGLAARRWPQGVMRVAGVAGAVVLLAAGGPVAYWLAWPVWTTESLMLLVVRNVALAASAVPAVVDADGRWRRSGAAASLFAVLGASVSTDHVLASATVAVFAAAGALWLAREAALRRGSPGAAARLGPAAVVAGVIVAAGTAGGAWVVHGGSSLGHGMLPGWFASSGGEGAGDARALRGVGDGPDEVASPDAASAGFDQSDFFSECHGDCLYDAMIETFGDPAAVASRQDFAHLQMLQVDRDARAADHLRQELRAGRGRDEAHRFGIERQTDPARRVRPPTALLWVEAGPGHLPLRLPMTAYDVYEGESWTESPLQAINSAMDNADAGGWFRPVDQPAGSAWGLERRVTLRFGDFDANVLPMPGGLTRFRMGRITRADLFASAREPMLRMTRQRVPAGSVVEAEYRPPVRRRLWRETFAEKGDVPGHVSPDHPAAELAVHWAGGRPRGWPQVQAVVDGLRAYAEVGPLDDGEGDAVERFLRGRRGEVYHFASASAVMLDALGYDVRLAAGFVVDPSRTDGAGVVAVTSRDAHVWPQVRLAAEAGVLSSRGQQYGFSRGGQWIDLEPTPGFVLADGSPTLGQQASAWREAASAWVTANRTVIVVWALAGSAAGVGLFLSRRRIGDGAGRLRWEVVFAWAGDDRARVACTLGFVESRARRRGQPRPAGATPARWVAPHVPGTPLPLLVDWALHAPASAVPPGDVKSICTRAVRGEAVNASADAVPVVCAPVVVAR